MTAVFHKGLFSLELLKRWHTWHMQNSAYNHNLNFNYNTDSNLMEVKVTFVVISAMLISLICFLQALW